MWNRLIPWGMFAWAMSRGRQAWSHHGHPFARRGHRTSTLLLTSLAFAGIGAGLMYLLDPAGGRRRRTVLRDRVTSAAHKAGDTVVKQSRHLKNVAQGLAHEATSKVQEATNAVRGA